MACASRVPAKKRMHYSSNQYAATQVVLIKVDRVKGFSEVLMQIVPV